MSSVRLEHISKSFVGKGKVLDDMSLEVIDRTRYVPPRARRASGKTTLLRIIAGVEKPDSGKVFFGENRRHRSPHAEEKGRDGVPEFRALPEHDGARNIASP